MSTTEACEMDTSSACCRERAANTGGALQISVSLGKCIRDPIYQGDMGEVSMTITQATKLSTLQQQAARRLNRNGVRHCDTVSLHYLPSLFLKQG